MNYDIIQYHKKYYIRLGTIIPTWQSGFSTIRCAQAFADSHDLETATESYIKYSPDDLEWIVDTYGFEWTSNNTCKLKLDSPRVKFTLVPEETELKLVVETPEKFHEPDISIIYGIDEILRTLDSYFGETIFASVHLHSLLDRATITAASNAREVTRNLVRVKSSNIWSYGIDIKDRKDKTGDVAVQFKGKNGGPTGGLYIYYDVPVNLWRKWLSASSKGHFFWVYIRNNFQYRKLDGDRRTHLKNGLN